MSIVSTLATLPDAQKRIVALLIIPLALVVLATAMCYPIFAAMRDQHVWREETRKALSRSAQAAQAEAQLKDELEQARQSQLWSKFYDATTENSAGAALQADVSAVLRSEQVEPQTLTPLPVTTDGRFKKIAARFTCSARIDQLRKVLTALASHSRYLRVERLKISAPQLQQPNDNAPLAVTLDVSGYQLIGGRAAFDASLPKG